MYLKQVINNNIYNYKIDIGDDDYLRQFEHLRNIPFAKWETIIFHTSLNDAQLLLNRILVIELTATLNRLV